MAALLGMLVYRLTHRDPHMPTHAPKKYLISHTSLQHCFDKSPSGLEKRMRTGNTPSELQH
jgi:hypothetical protein